MFFHNELRGIPSSNLKNIFLNNIFTDLMVAWDDENLLQAYNAEVLRNSPDPKPSFMTMNLAKIVFLTAKTSECPVICSAINPKGFRMNPSRRSLKRVF